MTRPYHDITFHTPDNLALYARDYPASREATENPTNSNRPTLVCIPGLTRNSADFEPLVAHIPSDFRIVVVDLRGRGRSAYDPNPMNYHPGTYVGDILALLQQLDLQDVVLIGTSLGGIVSIVLSSIDPSRIRGIILNDIGTEIVGEGLKFIQQYVGSATALPSWQEASVRAQRLYGRDYPDFTEADWLALAKRLYRTSAQGTPEPAYDLAISQLSKQMDCDNPPDLWEPFNAIRAIPMLLIHGQLSAILNQDIVEKMLQAKPDLKLCQLPNRGHAPLLNEPAAVKAIHGFLAGLI